VAATDRSAAVAYARACGIEPKLTLGKSDLMTRPGRLRDLIRRARVDAALVHSKDWRRQQNPQLYELMLAVMPVRRRFVVDESTGAVESVGAAGLALRIGRLPIDALYVTGSVVGTGVRLTRCKALRHWSTNSGGGSIPRASLASVLAIWPGSPDGFGGSVTHITGILGAFRAYGCRVALLTCFPPPQPLHALVDDVEVIASLPAASRMTSDTEQIGADARLTRLGLEFAERIRPGFVYQRHSPFLLAGTEIARVRRVPLVLEWNASEVWVRRNWQAQLRVERVLDPLLAAAEREIVSNATLIAAVSTVAAQMAFDSGATPEKTLVLPNAVSIEDIDSSIGGAGPPRASSRGAMLGWAGSFGSWHGAAVAVEALTRLPRDVRLVMIGDGEGRYACEAFADSLGVTARIEWTGALERGAALRRLAECDVLLSPHTPLPDQPFFGSPTKLFEYMALARPIVASRLGQLGEVLEDGVTARLVTPGDVDELAGAVAEILSSPDRGRTLGEEARRVVVRSHTWDQRGRAILERLGHGPRMALEALETDA
jgi:glycosyltransferase involved in cell wall biosynthesis